MNNNTIKKQLQKIAETILRLHDKLMNILYSFAENKEQGRRIIWASGRLYEAFTILKAKKRWIKLNNF